MFGKVKMLQLNVDGEVYFDKLRRTIYATDASAYMEEPLGVIYPQNAEDIRKAIVYACSEKLSLIPHTAGTSLAGQVVGSGLVLDCSKYAREIKKGNITSEQFTEAVAAIKLHGHCHQKSLASVAPSAEMLSLPINYKVEIIPSGCCGMAGSFGYEKEHYELSMAIGETTLFPEVRKSQDNIISAPGTSCRHQIKDGTGRDAYHPITLLYEALKE